MSPTPTLLRIALAAAAAASLLGGCSAGRTMPSPSGSIVQSIANAPDALSGSLSTPPLLYVSGGGGNYVNIYPATGQNQAPIGQLSNPGFDIAAGLAVDNAGNVYVSSVVNNRIFVFHRGSTVPYETLLTTNYVYGVGVDDTGTVYAAEAETGSAHGLVEIFPPNSTTPTSSLTDPNNVFSAVSVAIDSHHNVFVAYDAAINSPPGNIDEFKAGTTTPTNLGLNFANGDAWMTIDTNQHLVVPACHGGIRVYAVGNKKPLQVFGGGKPVCPTQAALNQSGKLLYVTESGSTGVANAVRVYSYPGGKLVNTITNGLTGNILGLAVDPRSPL